MSDDRRILVLGVNGQDGSYLADHLLARGYAVTGCGRQQQARYIPPGGRYTYQALDIGDLDALSDFLRDIRPSSIFHFAAVHGSAGFDYEAVWQDVQRVNTGAVQAILEYLRTADRACRLVYASSAKVFGDKMPSQICETTPRASTCLYSISKNAAHALIDYYRAHHCAKANVVYLFNHESPRRQPQYFVPRLVRILANALLGAGGRTELATLAFHCNWGSASEYMDICIDLMERGLEGDYVLAHDTTWFGRDMAAALFLRYGLAASEHVSERFSTPLAPSEPFQPSNAALERDLKRKPQQSILDVCEDILQLNHPEAWLLAKARRCA